MQEHEKLHYARGFPACCIAHQKLIFNNRWKIGTVKVKLYATLGNAESSQVCVMRVYAGTRKTTLRSGFPCLLYCTPAINIQTKDGQFVLLKLSFTQH